MHSADDPMVEIVFMEDIIKRRQYCNTWYQNHKEQAKIRYRKNLIKRKEYDMVYRQNHREQKSIRMKIYYLAHQDEMKVKQKKRYYSRNSEEDIRKHRECSREWRRANNWYGKLSKKIKDSRLKERIPAWANMERIKEWYRMAQMVTKLSGVQHTVDHIIPLCGDLVSGLHVENNLQILPFSENSKKSNKTMHFAV